MPRNPPLSLNLVPFLGEAKSAKEEARPPQLAAANPPQEPSSNLPDFARGAFQFPTLPIAPEKKEGVDFITVPIFGADGPRLIEYDLPLDDHLIGRGVDPADPETFGAWIRANTSREYFAELYERATPVPGWSDPRVEQLRDPTAYFGTNPWHPANLARGFAEGVQQAWMPGATEGEPWVGGPNPRMDIRDRMEMDPSHFGGEGWRELSTRMPILGMGIQDRLPEAGRHVSTGEVRLISDIHQKDAQGNYILPDEERAMYAWITGHDPDAMLPSQIIANRADFDRLFNEQHGITEDTGFLSGVWNAIVKSSTQQHRESYRRYLEASEEGDEYGKAWNFVNMYTGPLAYLTNSFKSDWEAEEYGRMVGKGVGLGLADVARGAAGLATGAARLVPFVGTQAARAAPSLGKTLVRAIEGLSTLFSSSRMAGKAIRAARARQAGRFPGNVTYASGEAGRVPMGGPGYGGRFRGAYKYAAGIVRGLMTTGKRYGASWNKSVIETATVINKQMDDMLEEAWAAFPRSPADPKMPMSVAEAMTLPDAKFATDILGSMLDWSTAAWNRQWDILYGEVITPVLTHASDMGWKTQSTNLMAKVDETLVYLSRADPAVQAKNKGLIQHLEKFRSGEGTGYRTSIQLKSLVDDFGDMGAALKEANHPNLARLLFDIKKAAADDFDKSLEFISGQLAKLGKEGDDLFKTVDEFGEEMIVPFHEFHKHVTAKNAYMQELIKSKVFKGWTERFGHERIGHEIWSESTTVAHITDLKRYMGSYFEPVAYHALMTKLRPFMRTAQPERAANLIPSLENLAKDLIPYQPQKLMEWLNKKDNWEKVVALMGEDRAGQLKINAGILERLAIGLNRQTSEVNAALTKGSYERFVAEAPVTAAALIAGGITGASTGSGWAVLGGAAVSYIVLTESLLRLVTGPGANKKLDAAVRLLESGNINGFYNGLLRWYEERERINRGLLDDLGEPWSAESPDTGEPTLTQGGRADELFREKLQLQQSLQPPPTRHRPVHQGWRRGRQ